MCNLSLIDFFTETTSESLSFCLINLDNFPLAEGVLRYFSHHPEAVILFLNVLISTISHVWRTYHIGTILPLIKAFLNLNPISE